MLSAMKPFSGLWTPVATPFGADGTVNTDRLVGHCRNLLADGSDGLAILGTTSEANSLTVGERLRIMDACVEAGIPASRLLPGTGATAMEDAAVLSRHAADLGCAGVLLLPPFYYKKVSDDGLFAFVGGLLDRMGGKTPRVLLYHIPPMAIVGWPTPLVARLLDAFPGIVVGMKDSSGDFDHVVETIESFPGFAVFPGAEKHLLRGMQAGAVGCISASANINARGISDLIANWRAPDAQRKQDQANDIRAAVEAGGLIPSIKAVLAARYRDDSWRAVRPPLMPLDPAGREELLQNPAIEALLGLTTA
jgi:4-hydroxy-tetrahydrodipicolinate synthase